MDEGTEARLLFSLPLKTASAKGWLAGQCAALKWGTCSVKNTPVITSELSPN